MSAARVAILGCGYLGSALARRLIRDGHNVVATTTTPDRVAEIEALGARAVVVELAQTDQCGDVLADRDVAILTAGAARAKRSYGEVYLQGARSLIQAAAGSPVRRIIYTSSTRVYGQDDGEWVDETSPTEPESENGRVLAETERCLLEGARALDATCAVARLSGISGPGRDPRERVRARAGQELSGGSVYVNLVHVDDVVSAMAALVASAFGGVMNVTDDHPTLRRDYYDKLIAAAGLTPIRWDDAPGAPVRGKRVRNDLMKRTLDISLEHPSHA